MWVTRPLDSFEWECKTCGWKYVSAMGADARARCGGCGKTYPTWIGNRVQATCETASVFSSCAKHPEIDTIAVRVTGGAYRVAPCPACSTETGPREMVLNLGEGYQLKIFSIYKSGVAQWDDGECDCR